MEEIIKLNETDKYNKMFGIETLHPLVSEEDMYEATGYPRHFTLNYGVYAMRMQWWDINIISALSLRICTPIRNV